MKALKQKLYQALPVFLGLAIVLAASTADAGKRAGDRGKRDVITEANSICGLGWWRAVAPTDETLIAACDLLFYTNGHQAIDISLGCDTDLDGIDNGVVTYSLRNCDKNENSLLRFAASAVMSIDDLVNRDKYSQAQTAANYLCGYADKFMALDGVGKLTSTMDLGADAYDIAESLVGPLPCE